MAARRNVLLLTGLVTAVLSARPALAQHAHAQMHHDAPAAAAPDVQVQVQEDVVELEARRNASGTAWQPATTPHLALHKQAGGFDLMFHTLLFAGFDAQSTMRGGSAPVGIGWLMGMARRRIGRGSLVARVMLSPEAWTVGYPSGGYPLLLQTGETFAGQALRDRQHAHDLFMELGLLYTQGLTDEIALQLYAAPAGEPALGPVAFPHRFSASSDPMAALGHHWQDSSHISFGVLTAGVILGGAKLEASWFNGREPDERRADIELRRPDSYAFRVSLAPTPAWALQASYGRLASPEALRPGTPVRRLTASALYVAPLEGGGSLAVTGVFGANKEGLGPLAKAGLVEANLELDGRNVVFARVELVQKERFDLEGPLPGAPTEGTVTVSSVSLGYLRNLHPMLGLLPGLGARGTLGFVPSSIEYAYGNRVLAGAVVFLRFVVAPSGHAHGANATQ